MKSSHPKVRIVPQDVIEQGLTMVQTAHRLCLKHPVNVNQTMGRKSAGEYTRPGICINFQLDTAAFTFIHELGHHLDYEELSSTRLKPASKERNSKLSRLVELMHSTEQFRKIINNPYLGPSKRRYYTSEVELWARAYTQFVLLRCIESGMKIVNWRYNEFFWDDDDFHPIDSEIRVIFLSEGWLHEDHQSAKSERDILIHPHHE